MGGTFGGASRPAQSSQPSRRRDPSLQLVLASGGEAHPGGCCAQPVVFPEVTLPTEMATFKQNRAGLTLEDQPEAGSCLHGAWLPAPTVDPWCDLGLK